MKHKKYLVFLAVIYFAVLIWSVINPKDYYTWVLEVTPGVIGFIILAFTYKRFRFTNLLYALMLIHCCILFVGGHYTYAEVPLFDWIRDLTNLGTQGYVWDTQSDMLYAFIGALAAVILFSKYHDSKIMEIGGR